MNTIPAKNDTLPALDNKPTQNGHIVVMTREQIDQLGDILDNPFLPLNDLQKALFMRGYRLIRLWFRTLKSGGYNTLQMKILISNLNDITETTTFLLTRIWTILFIIIQSSSTFARLGVITRTGE